MCSTMQYVVTFRSMVIVILRLGRSRILSSNLVFLGLRRVIAL